MVHKSYTKSMHVSHTPLWTNPEGNFVLQSKPPQNNVFERELQRDRQIFQKLVHSPMAVDKNTEAGSLELLPHLPWS